MYVCVRVLHPCTPLDAVSVCLTGARKTRRSPAEWRRHQRQVVFDRACVYIFVAKENFTIWPLPPAGTRGPTNGWHLSGRIDAQTAVVRLHKRAEPNRPPTSRLVLGRFAFTRDTSCHVTSRRVDIYQH